MSIQFREAREDDARAIANVHVSSWIAAYETIVPARVLDAQSVDKQEAFWRMALGQQRGNVFVAHDSSEIVGWAAFGPSGKDAATGELQAIYIRPDYFRSGIGRSLWEIAYRQLQTAGFKTVIAMVITDNHAARLFYEHIGFTLVPDSASTFTWEGEKIAEVCYIYRF